MLNNTPSTVANAVFPAVRLIVFNLLELRILDSLIISKSVKPLPRVTVARLEHPEKADAPILVTPSGIIILVRPAQL